MNCFVGSFEEVVTDFDAVVAVAAAAGDVPVVNVLVVLEGTLSRIAVLVTDVLKDLPDFIIFQQLDPPAVM